jgi:hypothetical protein
VIPRDADGFVAHHGIPDAHLIADTSSDRKPGTPFDQTFAEERAAIKAELVAAGADPNDIRTHFAVVREHDRRRAPELTYRQRQDLARWLRLPWVSPHPSDIKRPPVFTLEELQAIFDRFAGANDQIGQSVAAKALQLGARPL